MIYNPCKELLNLSRQTEAVNDMKSEREGYKIELSDEFDLDIKISHSHLPFMEYGNGRGEATHTCSCGCKDD